MPRFEYTAEDANRVIISGTVDAASVTDAAAKLEAQGLSVLSIGVVSASPADSDAIAAAAERVHACRSQLLEPLEAYAKEAPKRRRQELRSLLAVLRQDSAGPAAQAAASAPASWAPLLAAATVADDDQSVFARFIERDQEEQLINRRRSLVLVYPLIVAALVLLVLWPISVFLLPQFAAIYDDFGLALPAATESLIAFGAFLRNGGTIALFVVICFVFLGWLTWPRWRCWLFRVIGLPGWDRQNSIDAARYTRTVGDLLEAGFSIDAARGVAGSVCGSRPRPATAYALEASATNQARLAFLRELSACYSDQCSERAAWSRGVLGPFATVLIAMVIGYVVVALFMPLVMLIEGLT